MLSQDARIGRDQLFILARDIKWMFAVALFLAAALYVPDQISELYRVLAANRSLLELTKFAVSLAAIAAVVWLCTAQVARRSLSGISDVKPWTRRCAEAAPPLFGALPLFACALGLLTSAPSLEGASQQLYTEVGNPFRHFYADLAQTVGTGLLVSGIVVIVGALVFLRVTWRLRGATSDIAGTLASAYNERRRGIAVTIGLVLLVVSIAALFLIFPVGLPQALGAFGIIAIFAACLTLILSQLSILTIAARWPWIPSVVAVALLWAWFDWTDNHAVRPIAGQSDVIDLGPLPTANTAFIDWYESRPDLTDYPDGYPVYIVTAQGGGIYAAYQAATFLARAQDLMPNFRHHLFAISAVSGGSVGAATFAALLKDQAERPDRSNVRAHEAATSIGRYLASQIVDDLGNSGPLEQRAREILSADLLSPLVAATLFGDLAQKFIPWPIGSFDRARPLEFALEQAARETMARRASTLLDEPFLDHWSPTDSIPALLMNSTDAASGRRVIMAPFEVGVGSGQAPGRASLINFGALGATSGRNREDDFFRFRLSTAAFVSARFPWVTPAATIPLGANSVGGVKKARLVDGGYVDNSGVETAVDLIETLAPARETIKSRAERGDVTRRGVKYVDVKIRLIVLSGGDYPVRESFAFGETLEPLRALLSSRASRAYVAMARAARQSQEVVYSDSDGVAPDITVAVSDFRRSTVGSRYYPLPLGWAMSKRTGGLIAAQSGRFWDCEPSLKFTQSSPSLADADCVQLLTYHELNRSMEEATSEIIVAHYAQNLDPAQQEDKPRLDHERFLGCYEKQQVLLTFQANAVRALLRLWDNHQALGDERWLAFLMAFLSHDSSDFRVVSEYLFFTSTFRLMERWPDRFANLAEAATYLRNPRALANFVYGYQGNPFGNREPDDGWRYRKRGVYKLTGRGQYREFGHELSLDMETYPDLLQNKTIGAKVAFAKFLTGGHGNLLAKYFNGNADDWRGARALVSLSDKDGEIIERKGKMFLGCINEALQSGSRPLTEPALDLVPPFP